MSAIEQPILLIGRDGMLGRAWVKLLQREQLTHDAIDLETIDLTRLQTIDSAIDPKYRIVINCTAYTDVDGAEANEELALQINGTGIGSLADRCRQTGAKLVHYSTDYVFNGQATTPYPIDAPIEPLGAYGRTKAAGEQAIHKAGCDHLIIRTSWLYAPWGKNFVLTMLKLTQEKTSLKVVHDQRGRPTSAQHLAQISLQLLQANAAETYHVTDGGECSWYEFTQQIAQQVGSSCRIEPCNTDEFPRPAPRPTYSVLDLSKTEQLLGPMPNWQANLADVIQQAK